MEPQPIRNPLTILATCCLSLFVVTMDVTIINVALPAIRRDLNASITDLQWALDGYTVVIASFLMLSGATADRFGRRRIFQCGLALFTLGSLLCSLAPTAKALVLCRVVQALGGSMLNPVAMSIITNTFTVPRERARAIGVWGAVVGISMAIGPLLGGLLTEHVGWRSIFYINVPIGLAAIVLAWRFIPESRAPKARRFDPVGQILVALVLFSLTSGLIEGRRMGYDAWPIELAGAIVVFGLGGLVAYERRRDEPLIDPRFFRSIPLSVATITAVLAFTSFSGFLFLNALYLQEVRHLSASQAGLCMLPSAVTMFLGSPISGRLVGAGKARIATVGAGLLMATAGGLLATLTADTPMWQLVACYGLLGSGLGLVNAPITNAAVSGMPRAQAGIAAGIASTSRQVGASLGVALAGAIAGHAADAAFTEATHVFWWIVCCNGIAIVGLGFIATGGRARASVEALAPLLDA